MTPTLGVILDNLRECRMAHTANVYARNIARNPATVGRRKEGCRRIRAVAHALVHEARRAKDMLS